MSPRKHQEAGRLANICAPPQQEDVLSVAAKVQSSKMKVRESARQKSACFKQG